MTISWPPWRLKANQVQYPLHMSEYVQISCYEVTLVSSSLKLHPLITSIDILLFIIILTSSCVQFTPHHLIALSNVYHTLVLGIVVIT